MFLCGMYIYFFFIFDITQRFKHELCTSSLLDPSKTEEQHQHVNPIYVTSSVFYAYLTRRHNCIHTNVIFLMHMFLFYFQYCPDYEKVTIYDCNKQKQKNVHK